MQNLIPVMLFSFLVVGAAVGFMVSALGTVQLIKWTADKEKPFPVWLFILSVALGAASTLSRTGVLFGLVCGVLYSLYPAVKVTKASIVIAWFQIALAGFFGTWICVLFQDTPWILIPFLGWAVLSAFSGGLLLKTAPGEFSQEEQSQESLGGLSEQESV